MLLVQPPPMGSPPAYTSADEGPKTPPPRASAGSSQSRATLLDIQNKIADMRQESMNELIMRKISDPLQNLIRRASRLEDDSSNDDDDDDDDEDDGKATHGKHSTTYIFRIKSTETSDN